MNVREAIKVLADGGKVVDCDGDVWSMDGDGNVTCPIPHYGYSCLIEAGPYTLYVEPATDEDLIAEMERLAYMVMGVMEDVRRAYVHCADMLRTRKVKP